MCAGSEMQGSVVHLQQLGGLEFDIFQITQRKVCTLKNKFPAVPKILINGLNIDVN
jgi:hypothetical protein